MLQMTVVVFKLSLPTASRCATSFNEYGILHNNQFKKSNYINNYLAGCATNEIVATQTLF